MKKLAIGAIAAVVAVLSVSTTADAAQWRHRGFHNHGGWHHGWRHNGWHHGWRGGYWGPGWGFWGGPTIVFAPGYSDYCFVRKVRHHDRHGNVYIKRVRVCR